MEYKDAKIGLIVRHKLLGRVMLTKFHLIKGGRQWEVRRLDGTVMFVSPDELVKESRGDILRRLAVETKKLADLALAEADLLDKKEGKLQ